MKKCFYQVNIVLFTIFTGIILCFILECPGQAKKTDKIEITTRDTFEFRYQLKLLIPEFEKILILISDESTEPSIIEKVISNKRNECKDKVQTRLFLNEDVIVENDLTPGAETILPVTDLTFPEYLNRFNTMYNKSDDRSGVALSIIRISPLQKTTYYYYKVFTMLKYNNTLRNGGVLNPVNRVFEIAVLRDSSLGKWGYYISSIRFTRESDYDTLNNYHSIKSVPVDPEVIMREIQSESDKQKEIELKKINALMQEGDDKFTDGHYEEAREKYRDANIIDPYNNEIKARLQNTRKKMEEIRSATEKQKEIEERIKILKDEIQTQLVEFNFKNAKIICDSLVIDYNVKEDKYTKLRTELISIKSCIEKFETGREIKDKGIKNAWSLFDEEKNKLYATNPIYKSELYYQMALTVMALDSSNEKQIIKNLDESLRLSENKHQGALKARASLYNKLDKPSKAIGDATTLIENIPRDPKSYIFRANLYMLQKSNLKAIEDYSRALELNSPDTTIYLLKSMLEYDESKFDDAEKTSSEGLKKTKCYGSLFFARAKVRVRLNNYIGAGSDFRSAAICGISVSDRKYVELLANSFIQKGNEYYNTERFIDAVNQFAHAIDVDSSLLGLYSRGKTYISMKKYDLAISDLNTLIRKNKNVENAYCLRGLAYMNKELYYEAGNDFSDELRLFPNNFNASYYMGICAMKLGKFKKASQFFENASKVQKSDSALFNAAWAYYYNNDFNAAVKSGSAAINAFKTRRWESYYVTGRAYLQLKNYKDAANMFGDALKVNPYIVEVLLYNAFVLEKRKEYEEAIDNYSKISTGSFRDTAVFRAAVCEIKTDKKSTLVSAEAKLRNFENTSDNSYRVHSNLWLAYIYILEKNFVKAEMCLAKVTSDSSVAGLENLFRACMKAQQAQGDEAFQFLEKALISKQLNREDIAEENLLDPIRDKKMRKLIEKYFP